MTTYDQIRRWQYLWLLIALASIAIFLYVFLSDKNADKTESPVRSEKAWQVATPSKPVLPDGWLKRTKRVKTPEEQDEITMKKKEVFARALEVGKDIVNQDYESALEKLVEYYTWTFENDFVASAGVRSSFLLENWKKLIAVYPPAEDKLREMADHLEETMRTEEFADVNFGKEAFAELPPEQRDDFIALCLMREICNFNSVLGTLERGVDLLADLLSNEPDVAQACWRGAEDVLFETKSYELLNTFIPDLNAEYDRALKQVQDVLSERPPQPTGMSKEQYEEIQNVASRHFIERHIGRLFEFGLGTEQEELVQELASRARDEFPFAADIFEKYQ